MSNTDIRKREVRNFTEINNTGKLIIAFEHTENTILGYFFSRFLFIFAIIFMCF